VTERNSGRDSRGHHMNWTATSPHIQPLHLGWTITMRTIPISRDAAEILRLTSRSRPDEWLVSPKRPMELRLFVPSPRRRYRCPSRPGSGRRGGRGHGRARRRRGRSRGGGRGGGDDGDGGGDAPQPHREKVRVDDPEAQS